MSVRQIRSYDCVKYAFGKQQSKEFLFCLYKNGQELSILKMILEKKVTNRKADCCGTVPELS